MTALIAARGISAGYAGSTVVRQLDLEVHAGQVVALLGPNGAGKTTTIMTLAGEVPARAGQVLWRGTPTKAPLHRRSREGLGLVTETRAVLMTLTVAENLRVAQADVAHTLRLFPELEEHMSRRVGLLSGGQQQMLALGQALGRRPQVLLADELSVGLAPLIVDRLLTAVRRAADDGLGVLLVEQHVHKAMLIADHVHVLRRGRVQMSGTVAELQDRVDEIQESYLSTANAQDVDGDDRGSLSGRPCASD